MPIGSNTERAPNNQGAYWHQLNTERRIILLCRTNAPASCENVTENETAEQDRISSACSDNRTGDG